MTVIKPTSPWHPRRLARTAGFVLGAMAIAGGAFVAVLHFQPAVAPIVSGPKGPMSTYALEPEPAMRGGMGPVTRPSYVTLQDGRVVSEFTAAQFSPRENSKDGMVDVVRPVARFYLKKGQFLVLTGDSGEVAFGNPGGNDKAGMMMSSGTKMPDTGKLRHVHIDLFPTVAATQPTLKMDTDNVRFDNDTLRLYTEKIPATATEPEVPADRVPVVVRGTDYNMDGTGLTLRLSSGTNSRDRQLHLLEISHGIRLTILHPAAMGAHHDATTAVAPSAQSPAAPPRGGVAPPVTQPTKQPAAKPLGSVPRAATVASPKDTKPLPPQAYRAVFNDQVRIAEGDPSTASAPERTLATGDVLTLDFSQKRGDDDKSPTVKVVHATSAPAPTTAPISTVVATTAPVTAPAVVATTKPAKLGEEPITIYWTGKLRVTPIDTAATMMPLDPGESVVRLTGRRAMVTFNGATAEAATATYRSPDHAVRLDPSEASPTVRLTQQIKGMTVDARSVDYDPVTSVATILGPATLHVTEPGKHPATLTATWADRALLHVVDAGADPSGIDHIDLIGDVHADDPRLSMSCHRLLLDLDDPHSTTQPSEKSDQQLRRLTAVGAVVCRMLRPGRPDQGIEGDRLVIGMAPGPDGKSVPRSVVADGRQVHAFDADQALFADHLEALLTPRAATTKPAEGEMGEVELESMYASGHVRAALPHDAMATADVLRETTAPGGTKFVELSGTTGARVTTAAHDELVGSVLHVTDKGPDDYVVVVDGPGTLHTISKPTTKPTTKSAGDTVGKPVDVSWTDGLSFDNLANTADVVGHVLVRSVDPNDPDGTVNRASGDKAHIDFQAARKTKDPKKVATTEAKGANDSLGNKELKALTLSGHMVAESESVVGGDVMRYGRLTGDRLVYTASDGIARVPGPGNLFVENHRRPNAKPAKGDAKGDGGTESKAGTMGVGWQGGMAFDQNSGVIHIVGDVHVGFLPDNANPVGSGAKPTDGGPMQLRSDDMVITMVKSTDKAKKDTQSISRMLATGGVQMTTKSIDVHCHGVDFSPITNILIATGSDAEPGRAVGSAAASASGGFGKLVFNTKTNTVEHVEDVNGSFRR